MRDRGGISKWWIIASIGSGGGNGGRVDRKGGGRLKGWKRGIGVKNYQIHWDQNICFGTLPRALPTVFANNQILRMPSTALSGIFSAQKEENLIKVNFNLVLGVLCSREL